MGFLRPGMDLSRWNFGQPWFLQIARPCKYYRLRNSSYQRNSLDSELAEADSVEMMGWAKPNCQLQVQVWLGLPGKLQYHSAKSMNIKYMGKWDGIMSTRVPNYNQFVIGEWQIKPWKCSRELKKLTEAVGSPSMRNNIGQKLAHREVLHKYTIHEWMTRALRNFRNNFSMHRLCDGTHHSEGLA